MRAKRSKSPPSTSQSAPIAAGAPPRRRSIGRPKSSNSKSLESLRLGLSGSNEVAAPAAAAAVSAAVAAAAAAAAASAAALLLLLITLSSPSSCFRSCAPALCRSRRSHCSRCSRSRWQCVAVRHPNKMAVAERGCRVVKSLPSPTHLRLVAGIGNPRRGFAGNIARASTPWPKNKKSFDVERCSITDSALWAVGPTVPVHFVREVGPGSSRKR
mmetsp:Transcript_66896/g.139667  ORF Transcript_66896/g.139667 Transcript_66896/m.139667 type:complete len:214 (-) Transcript_66896:200-841(-)